MVINMKLNCELSAKVVKELQAHDIKCYIVGGYVRDSLLGLEPKDIDIELHHTDVDQAFQIISQITDAKVYGSFGVISLTAVNTEFAIAREETKTGNSHTNFDVEFITNGDLKLAAARRDFTINSMMYDLQKNLIIDNYYGREDLQNRILRHVSAAFSEDSLRILRGIKFIARYNLTIDHQTDLLCRAIISELKHLPTSRIETEVIAIFKAKYSSVGLELLTTYLQLLFEAELERSQFTTNNYLNQVRFFKQFKDYNLLLNFCFEQKKIKKDLSFVIKNYDKIEMFDNLLPAEKYQLFKDSQYITDYLFAINPNLETKYQLFQQLIAVYNGQYFLNKGYRGKQIANQQIIMIGGILDEL